MNEPMDREELIEAIERSLDWLIIKDEDDAEVHSRVTVGNATVQRSLREAQAFLKALHRLPSGRRCIVCNLRLLARADEIGAERG